MIMNASSKVLPMFSTKLNASKKICHIINYFQSEISKSKMGCFFFLQICKKLFMTMTNSIQRWR